MTSDLPTIHKEPTGTFPHYLVIHTEGPSLCGLVDMIDQYVGDAGTIQAIYMLTPDGGATGVTVEDVTGGDSANIEFEIYVGDEQVSDTLVDYVCFLDEESNEVTNRMVYVDGFITEPDEAVYT